jgi:hypothetical protein
MTTAMLTQPSVLSRIPVEPGELSLCDRAAIYTIDNAWWHLVSNYGRDEAVILLERLRRECGGASA